MSWSLDWFASEKLARAGAQIRRVAWTDRVLTRQGALWMLVTSSASEVVKTTDFGADELNARDWTDQPFSANPCAAVPAYNSAPVVYGRWTAAPIFLPPPVPGFPDPET
ncbi:MAG: hypothetical protein P4L99_24115 [Chthoniobacter sp.]|nr:hypothetical protein [Chthoniobacter sp.]